MSINLQPDVFGPPLWLSMQIISFNFPNSAKCTKAHSQRYVKWLRATVKVIPHKRARRCARKKLKELLQGKKADGFDRESFSRLVHSLMTQVELCCGCGFLRSYSYTALRDRIETCRARCLNVEERKDNALQGVEDGCTEVSEGRVKLKACIKVASTTDSHCWKCPAAPPEGYGSYDSGDGMQTRVWGPILWFLLHLVTYASNTRKPGPYLDWILKTGGVLPCRYCRENFYHNLVDALGRMKVSATKAGAKKAWEEAQRLLRSCNSIYNQLDDDLRPQARKDYNELHTEWRSRVEKQLAKPRPGGGNLIADLVYKLHRCVSVMLDRKHDVDTTHWRGGGGTKGKPPATFEDFVKTYSAYHEDQPKLQTHVDICALTKGDGFQMETLSS